MSDRLEGSSASHPIKHRGWNIYLSGSLDWRESFFFCHDDWEPETRDERFGYARSVEAACREINDREDGEPVSELDSSSHEQMASEQSQKPDP